MNSEQYQKLLNGEEVDLTESAQSTATKLMSLYALKGYTVDEPCLNSVYGVIKLQNQADLSDENAMQLG